MVMRPLIDGDILLYEVGFKSQKKTEEGLIEPVPLEVAYATMDKTIQQICTDVYATEGAVIYLTGKENFRNEILQEVPYKGNRDKKDKPIHYEALLQYVQDTYFTKLVDGLEADDLLSIDQHRELSNLNTVICSRDKDLRIQPGMHYGWEVAGQPRFGPAQVSDLGTLQLKRGGKKIFGTGRRFFYSQCLTGDKVDNIPGVKGYGPVKAFKTLVECKTMRELEDAVIEVYKKAYDDEWEEKLTQRGQCLWMTRELNEDGSPVLWQIGSYMED